MNRQLTTEILDSQLWSNLAVAKLVKCLPNQVCDELFYSAGHFTVMAFCRIMNDVTYGYGTVSYSSSSTHGVQSIQPTRCNIVSLYYGNTTEPERRVRADFQAVRT